MGGELGYDHLVGGIRRWIGRVIIALGTLALLSCVVVTISVDGRTSAFVGLAGLGVIMLGAHMYWGLKHWRRAVTADGGCIVFAAFPLAEVIGAWGYLLAIAGVAILLAMLVKWDEDY